MGSIISSHWEIIHFLQKCNLSTAKKLKYCVKNGHFCTAHKHKPLVLISQATHSRACQFLTHQESTAIFCNDYPKPITQALISTSEPALVGCAHFQE